ncbi:MAG: Ppx/GppA phosphatase family protein [Geminicoccaceae bacterium]|nr:Ppx/GppA phosphatase family protein [Geminicoccaceae bacterium]
MRPLPQPAVATPAPARFAPGDRLAALDLGTNNCRLLVVEAADDGFVVIDSFARITRLGEGLARHPRLSEAAMARTLAALKVCARIIARHRCAFVRCVATEACRRAVNGPEFVRRVRKVTGLELEILSPAEEARLAMLGCLPLADPAADRLLVLDIGGGSTDLLWLDRNASPAEGEPGIPFSLPLGVVTLAETFGREVDEPTYARMVDAVHAALERLDLPRPRAEEGGLEMLGTSGTVTTLAALAIGLRRYDRNRVDGLELPFATIRVVAERLRAAGNAGRAAHPCIGRGRADLVVAGCAILDAVHRVWPVTTLKVADRGLREGILAALMGASLADALRPRAAAA